MDGIFISDASAYLFLRTVDKQPYTLQLEGVEALRADNFRQGNIIFELNVSTVDQLDESFVFQLYEYSVQRKESFVLEEWRASALHKGLSGFEMTSSYGCMLSAMFKSHRFAEGHSFPINFQ
jgi:hypothetical protein